MEKKQLRRLKRLAREPFGPWERRDWAPHMWSQILGHDDVHPDLLACRHGFLNNRYQVLVSEVETELGVVTHLWVKRHDQKTIHSWSDLQRIKDEIVGPNREAVEIYPARDSIVDQANMYHLWVLPEGARLPFGLTQGDDLEKEFGDHDATPPVE